MRIVSVLLSLLVFTAATAAEIRVNDKLQWNGNTRLQTGPATWVEVLSLHGAYNDPARKFLPVYSHSVNLPQEADLQFEFVNTKFEPVTVFPEGFDVTSVPADIKVYYSIGYFKKKPVADISFIPLRRNSFTGQVERLVEFSLQVRMTPNGKKQSGSSATYATTSVLNSGAWYKISVDKDGLYKIDYDFLKSLGINPDNIDPRNLHIYGNGGGMLPEANAETRHDDLTENAIIISGEGDGAFNQGDYILFYGQGPDRWKPQGDSIYLHELNLYSKVTTYFVTVNGTMGKRIGSAPQASNPTETVTAFDDYQFHDLEDVNFIQSGRQWFGEYFNFSVPNQTFTFDFPNIVTSEQIYFRGSAGARSLNTNSAFNFTVNGQQAISLGLDAVGTVYTNPYASAKVGSKRLSVSSGTLGVSVTYSNPSSSAEGWLDFIEINARRSLVFNGGLLHFRDIRSKGAGKRAEFVLQGAGGDTKILDVTDPTNVQFRQTTQNGSQLSFVANTDVLREFLAYNDNSPMYTPVKVGPVPNQNLHGIGQPDMVIITSASLVDAANRLANHHRSYSNLTVAVVDVQQIYNEFSTGSQDVSAIRDFMKMLYDRAGADPNALPQYLLLFGDGSYDYKDLEPNNTNMVPTYESRNSTSPVSSYCTDDYFGYLDVNEGGNFESDLDTFKKLDVAIGRIPVSTLEAANNMVNKIMHYQSSATFGNWRNNLTFIGDDEDGNLHLGQALGHAQYMESNFPVYNVDKIMLDAYKQQSTPAGSRYPDVKEAINKKMFAGSLIMNYTGHGGINGLAHERILDATDIRGWENYDKMPLYITATCEFSKFDDPNKSSAGEEVYLNPKGGAIALVTTVRLVFAGDNDALNDRFLENCFNSFDGNRMPTVGEALMLTKNVGTIIKLGGGSRKFVLLGDPAMTLAYPQYNVVTTHIDSNNIATSDDTLKALQKVTISGEVRDLGGNKMTGFNGVVYPTIFDKEMDVTTLANDPGSRKATFKLLKNVIFKGKATVTNGNFSYTFIVPKDISYNYGNGKISYYAENGTVDANGYTTDLVIGGTADSFAVDGEGPELKVFMNDEKFVLGGLTDASPLLLVKLGDFSGINTVGNGIGHDITGILDDNTQKTLVLNDFYESAKDDYQKGEVRYPLSEIADGRHTMKVKAWDVYNNSAEGYTEFVVASSANMALDHVLNYPNPFTTSTNFMFEHNKPGEALFVQVKIFTVSGKLVKTIQQNVQTEGYRIDNIHWDGLDDYGDKIGKGVYVYKLNVATASGEVANKFEKLVILR